MVPSRAIAFLSLLSLGAAGTAGAQGFKSPSAPGGNPSATMPMQGQPGGAMDDGPGAYQQAPMQQGGGFGAPPPQNLGQGFGGGGPQQPGFGPPPGAGGQLGFGGPGQGGPQPQQQPARRNYADELTDFGVPPQAEMQPNVGSPTPTSIPGGHVITTNEMRQAAGNSGILFVDVLAGRPHPEIPGAIWLPGAGQAGTFDDDTQRKLWSVLSQATHMNPNQPIAFFCLGSRCWESYNAALRAERLGFKMVLWYRGGLAAWQAAGLPMTSPDQGGGVGFGAAPGGMPGGMQGPGGGPSQDDDSQ